MSRLPELQAKVDAFFTRVAARHGADMQCASGCADCCHARLTITATEAAAIRAEVATWPAPARRALGAGPPAASGRCAALDDADRCTIYAVRPLVCRSHGVPVKLQRNSLPVVCPKNFRSTIPDADCVLDQATLSTVLGVVDRAEHPDAPRVDLGDLLAEIAIC